MNKLVSVVSSCYNGETYIARYLEAMLKQTYRPIEMVLINNGCTDNTDEIIMSYKEKLEQSGVVLKYIKKQNEGLGAAINYGLKHTTGEYLIWPDTDDFLFPESIEKRVAFLEEHPEFGFVYSDGQIFNESNIEVSVRNIKAMIPSDGKIFKNILSGRKVVYTPCGYMLRMSAFLDVNPEKEIYPSSYGQNIQMLMPISYKYRCGHLKEILYGRVERNDSLSKSVWNMGIDSWKNRILGHGEIYIETLKTIGGEALAYIPYIYYRNLRILKATSKKINKKAYGVQKETLKISTRMLILEVLKTLFRKG